MLDGTTVSKFHEHYFIFISSILSMENCHECACVIYPPVLTDVFGGKSAKNTKFCAARHDRICLRLTIDSNLLSGTKWDVCNARMGLLTTTVKPVRLEIA